MFENTLSFSIEPISWIGGILLLMTVSLTTHADEPIDRIYEQFGPRVDDLTRHAISESTVSRHYQVTLGFDVYYVTFDKSVLSIVLKDGPLSGSYSPSEERIPQAIRATL